MACVVREIRDMGLRVSPQKTEAIFFHDGKHGVPPGAHVSVDGTPVWIGTQMKYLGLILDRKWTFIDHFSRLAPRVDRVAAALSRLLSNIGGPDG
ncbi:reverse transcriptase [Lasius niger]|uniref:Reverse transcriptase n=1 Tax=Lasius niger TaxID=67767 RepID=A0A0J7MZ59_LASNI|nr:reverse transcriptase [Lasius niger]